MTTEIVIMNRSAIALAADSAVTLFEGEKIFNKANKVFMLSRHHPVGILIYGNADFFGIPLEVIIKTYRKRLGKKVFDSLEEYSKHFISFLEKDVSINEIIIKNQDNTFETFLDYVLDIILHDFNDNYMEDYFITQLDEKSMINFLDPEIISRLEKYCEDKNDELEKDDFCEGCDSNLFKKINKSKGKYIKKIISEFKGFKYMKLSEKTIECLIKIAINALIKDDYFFSDLDIGIVITGFGEKDVFPQTYSFKIHSVYENFLIMNDFQERIISIENPVEILSYGQSDMIDTFTKGVSPYYMDFLDEYISEFSSNYPLEKMKNIQNLDEKVKKTMIDEFKKDMSMFIEKFKEETKIFSEEVHYEPIEYVVSLLPKDELGIMAETLINLTSFKRKVSLDEESVGGPTDVAIISKGDGFVWIKRKHYFKAELNPDYFRNING